MRECGVGSEEGCRSGGVGGEGGLLIGKKHIFIACFFKPWSCLLKLLFCNMITVNFLLPPKIIIALYSR